MSFETIVRCAGLAAFLVLAGCDKLDPFGAQTADAPAAPIVASEATRKASPNRAESDTDRDAPSAKARGTGNEDGGAGRVRIAPAELPAPAPRGALFQRLPKTTLLATRLPHVEKLGAAFERTTLRSLFDSAGMVGERARMDEALAAMTADITKAIPDFEEIRSRVRALEGEVVVALIGFDASVLAHGAGDVQDLPVTVAVMFDAGEHAPLVEELLSRLWRALDEKHAASPDSAKRFDVVSTSATGWHRRMVSELFCADLVRDGSQLFLQIGPTSGARVDAAPLAVRALDDSFAACDVVRGTPDLARGGAIPVAEVFVNLAPVWNAVELFAPPDVKRVLADSGATSINGLSAAAALGRTGIDETLMVHAPAGRDLLTRALTKRPIDASLARFVPADARGAALGTLDLAELFDGIVALLPQSEKRGLENALTDMRREGIDLRADVLTNLGPTFGAVGELDLAGLFTRGGAARKPIDLTLLVELHDAPRLQRLLDRFTASGSGAPPARTVSIDGFAITSFDPVPLPGPDGTPIATIEPCWHVDDRAFVFSLSRSGLAHALAAGAKRDNRGPKALAAALEEHGATAFSIQATDLGGAKPSLSIGRRTSLGLEITSREGAGTASTGAVVAAASIASSVAIPFLLNARVEANERAALANLHCLASAQAQFVDRKCVDQDQDGRGEYGTLAELTGAAPRRDGRPAIEPPFLVPAMRPDEDGLFERSGYVFRVDVPKRTTRDPDADEIGYELYAWPISHGQTGRRVFVRDAHGDYFASDNCGAKQQYEGRERAPEAEAAKMRFEIDRIRGTNDHRGRDDGLWRKID